MEVFRIALDKYAHALTSSGSANRWNYKGQHVLYAGQSRALASLELVVHRSFIQPHGNYRVLVISIADDPTLVESLPLQTLPHNWRKLEAYPRLQERGGDWYRRKSSLILKVPSAVIPFEFNYIINTEHPAFAQNVSLVRTEDFFWDQRLME